MKRSTQVPASLIITLAAGIVGSGCGSRGYTQCVDSMGRPIPDSYCSTGGYAGAHWTHVQTGGFGTTGSTTGSGSFGG